jgi:hypothetical protein
LQEEELQVVLVTAGKKRQQEGDQFRLQSSRGRMEKNKFQVA